MSKLLRIKCPSCQLVTDIAADGPCPKCHNQLVLPVDGVIQLYRMGSPFGMAVGFGIYLNDIPMGHLANTESIRIPVPYGHYKLHMTQGISRRCNDLEFDVTPNERIIYVKANLNMGFFTNTVNLTKTTADTMPPL